MKLRQKLLISVAVIAVSVIYLRQQIVESWMRYSLRNETIVVTLTTTPHRINKIAENLDRLSTQNIAINKIYLSIPYAFKRDNISYEIPAWLQQRSDINILRTEDYGPATKLLGVLQQIKFAPDTIIVTVDDDVVYPENLILQLAYYAQQHPAAAIGVMGAMPIYDKHGRIDVRSEYGLRRISAPDAQVSILQGWAGVAYRAKFFDKSIFDIANTIQECRNSDDVYLSFYLAKHRIQRLIVRNSYISPQKLNKESTMANGLDALFKQTPSPVKKHRTCIAYLQRQDPHVLF